MRESALWIALTALLAFAAGTWAQSPAPAGTPQAGAATADQPDTIGTAGQEALSWDRDFDLLLELKDAPTRAELDLAARRQALTEERARLTRKLADLQARLDALQGTYSTETLLNEMLRQGVSDMQTVVANLSRDIKATKLRIDEVDHKLKRLGSSAGAAP